MRYDSEWLRCCCCSHGNRPSLRGPRWPHNYRHPQSSAGSPCRRVLSGGRRTKDRHFPLLFAGGAPVHICTASPGFPPVPSPFPSLPRWLCSSRFLERLKQKMPWLRRKEILARHRFRSALLPRRCAGDAGGLLPSWGGPRRRGSLPRQAAAVRPTIWRKIFLAKV